MLITTLFGTGSLFLFSLSVIPICLFVVATDAELRIAALTGGERNNWAKTRCDHFSSGINRDSVHAIEESLFLVTHCFLFFLFSSSLFEYSVLLGMLKENVVFLKLNKDVKVMIIIKKFTGHIFCITILGIIYNCVINLAPV